jgi:trk system potassium uptake protein TrkA
VHVVIMGCGRVGSELAARLEGREHSVAVIDKNANSFRNLRPGFRGQTVLGYGFDEHVLNEAGIERADAFAAVSSGDNSNIVAARLVRERYSIEVVVARIYDPRRAEIYQRLGIPTVATVKWTTDQVMRQLFPEHIASDWKDPTEGISLVTLMLPDAWVRRTVADLEMEGHCRVIGVNRLGHARIVDGDQIFQQGDQLHLAVDRYGLEKLRPLVLAARREATRDGSERFESGGAKEVAR